MIFFWTKKQEVKQPDLFFLSRNTIFREQSQHSRFMVILSSWWYQLQTLRKSKIKLLNFFTMIPSNSQNNTSMYKVCLHELCKGIIIGWNYSWLCHLLRTHFKPCPHKGVLFHLEKEVWGEIGCPDMNMMLILNFALSTYLQRSPVKLWYYFKVFSFTFTNCQPHWEVLCQCKLTYYFSKYLLVLSFRG